MTVKTVIKDDRYQRCGPLNCVTTGQFWRKVQSGSNGTPGHYFDEFHEYSMEFYNFQTSDGSWWPLADPSLVRVTSVDPVNIQGRPWDNNDENKLLSKLKEAYDGHDWNGGAMAGEMGKTVDSLAGRARQLAGIANALKRGRPDRALKILRGKPPTRRSVDRMADAQRRVGRNAYRRRFRDRNADPESARLSDTWLEGQYGILPLVGDCFALSEAIAAYGKPRKKRLSVRHNIDRTVVIGSNLAGSGKAQYGKQIIAYVEPAENTWPVTMGLADPASVLWELVPFSFVVDWFLPVGTYLEAANIAARARGTFITTVRDRHWAVGGGWRDGYTSPSGYAESAPTQFFSRRVSINRTITTQLSAKLPTFRNPLSYNGAGTKIANAIALVAGAFSKRG